MVYMATYVTMLQIYKTTSYLLVERSLCIVQASRFLSPSVSLQCCEQVLSVHIWQISDVEYLTVYIFFKHEKGDPSLPIIHSFILRLFFMCFDY